MGGYGVAVIELAIICRRCATVLKLNASPLDNTHRYQLATRSAKTSVAAMGRTHEPVARSHADGLPLMDGKRACLYRCEASLLATCVASGHRARVNTADGERLVFLYTPCCPMNYQCLPLTVVRQITFLRFRPLQRDVLIHRDALTEMAALKKVIANRASDTANSLMCKCDYQNAPRRPRSVYRKIRTSRAGSTQPALWPLG